MKVFEFICFFRFFFKIFLFWISGRWENASWTDHRSIDEFLLRNVVILDVFLFTSFIQLKFLLTYPRKVSVINSQVKKKTSLVSFLFVVHLLSAVMQISLALKIKGFYMFPLFSVQRNFSKFVFINFGVVALGR